MIPGGMIWGTCFVEFRGREGYFMFDLAHVHGLLCEGFAAFLSRLFRCLDSCIVLQATLVVVLARGVHQN